MEICTRFLSKKIFWWAGAITLSFVLIFINVRGLSADNERVVTLHHDGIEQTVVTDAATIADVLKRTSVNLGQYDEIEPAKDTKLTAPSYDINIYRARPVTIVDGTMRHQIMTAATSTTEILKTAHVPLYPEDLTNLSRINDFVADDALGGLKLTIQRATSVNFVLYGKQLEVRTQHATIGELLKEKDVILEANDAVNLPANTPITAGLTVEVWRNGVQTITEDQAVPFTTKTVRDADKPVGYKQVQLPGVLGKKVVTYQIDMRNGQEVSRKQIQSVITEQPQEQTEVIGVQVSFTGAFQDALAKLRLCEAGGNYARNSGNGYYGAYQYDVSTWANYQGYARADLAPPEAQDQKAWATYQARGWRPWPTCSAKLGLQDVYR